MTTLHPPDQPSSFSERHATKRSLAALADRPRTLNGSCSAQRALRT